MEASNGTGGSHRLCARGSVELSLPRRERVPGSAWALYSERGSYLGLYPPRLHAHMRDALEAEVRGFEELAERVGVTYGPGRVNRLNGWFEDCSGAGWVERQKERNEYFDHGCCGVHRLAPGG